MNYLIDSNSTLGKFAHYEEIHLIICILCGFVKHHVVTEPKKHVSAN